MAGTATSLGRWDFEALGRHCSPPFGKLVDEELTLSGRESADLPGPDVEHVREAQVTADHIGDLASEMSKLGGVDDELVQQGANMLLTFTKVRNEVGKGNDIFDQATLAANNYAAATGTDVVAANKLLGAVLNDPLKGLTKLTKAGVQFTQQQRDQIAAMVASGDTMGAQKVILAEFTKQFGGSLEANATASGKAQVALENMGESVGAILAPAMEAGAGALEDLATKFSSLPSSTQTAIIGIGGVGTAAVLVVPKLVDFASAIGKGASAVSDFAGKSATIGKATSAIEGVVGAVGGLPIVAAAGATGIGILAAGFVDAQIEAQRTKADVSDLQQMITGGFTPGEASAKKLANTLAGVDGGFQGLTGSSKKFREDLDEVGLSTEDAARVMTMTDKEFKKFADGLHASHPDLGGTSNEIFNLTDNLDLMRGKTSEAADQDKRLVDTTKALTDAGLGQALATDEVTSSTGELADATGEATRAGDGWLGSNRDLIDAYRERITKQQEINDGMQDAIDLSYASVDANLALRSAHDSVQDATTALDEARKNGSSPETIQRSQDDLTAAIMRESVATRDAAVANAEAAGKSLTAGEAARIQRDKLVELQQQTGFTSGELRGLVTNLDNAARQRQVQLDTSQAIANIRSLIGALGDLSAVGSATGAAGSIINAGVAGVLGNLGPPRARGGDVHAGGMNLVGERGPELVRWGASGTVIPAAKTKQIMAGGTSLNGGTRGYGGGGSVTNIWNITETTSARATANEVARILNRETRMGRNPLVGANG